MTAEAPGSKTPRSIDTLIQNAHVVTLDDQASIVADGAIAIHQGRILEVGPSSELTMSYAPARRIFAAGQIALPGLTDAHIHTAQTLMRGLLSTLGRAKALRVPTWREYLVPFEASLTPEDIELSGQLAYSSMLATGTTSFFEAGGPHPESMARAATETGIRGAVSLSTMDGGSRIPASMRMSTEEALQRNIDLVDAWPHDPAGENRVSACMSLRQIITCTPDLVTGIHQAAQERGVKVHTHLVEGTYEIDYALENFGQRPVEYLLDLGVFDHTLHGAHSVLASIEDVEHYAAHGVSAAHCSKGNYAIGAAPALKMWRKGVAIGLGTDGVANAGTLDMFRIAMLTRVGQQYIEGTPVHNRNIVGLEEPLQMAVTGGARAMATDGYTGALETGKRADIVLIGTDGPDAAGYSSPEAFLFECASGRDVKTVLVDGQIVVDDGEVTTVDTEAIRAEAAVRQRELVAAIA
ncbi:amidohydrolase family protein [Nesterenkonia populi]|uniref:amidohydrolase family protein n=1 Tax=Nesterenkonia populi TaxID=1591087 RepID=UPI0011BD5527|nr:amidohydrolase family protein [Nesterenkonia populi]